MFFFSSKCHLCRRRVSERWSNFSYRLQADLITRALRTTQKHAAPLVTVIILDLIELVDALLEMKGASLGTKRRRRVCSGAAMGEVDARNK